MSRPMEFELTEHHLALLRRMYVGWQDCESGAPEIDPQRPYGNSDVPGDVANILGVTIEKDDGGWETAVGDAVSERLRAIHAQTEIALQVVLFTGEFRTGKFYRPDRYDTRTWLREEG